MSNLPALYTIADCYLADVAKLQDLDLDPQTLADTLESLTGELEVKATNVAMFVRNLESLADQIKQAEATMSARRKAIEHRADAVREYLLANMQRTGITKIESPYFRISIKQNPASVVITDETQIPSKYLRQPPIPAPVADKKEIKAALEFGENIKGCELQRTVRLEIK
jgi:hypothetical protein